MNIGELSLLIFLIFAANPVQPQTSPEPSTLPPTPAVSASGTPSTDTTPTAASATDESTSSMVSTESTTGSTTATTPEPADCKKQCGEVALPILGVVLAIVVTSSTAYGFYACHKIGKLTKLRKSRALG
ncbi:hypothetical protein RvY_03895 [Ramazzottius varieornatus]|uniref:Uncharacterized protein n=1 Tax=Ramazzottius varieornatus TaxID=947166 RepID=A0A1D1UT93_RAMVA|nr:hypothetical protein RvY_03895 [Ramazzottius varieornatus]